MPTASFSTLATGTRQLVVQEALETTRCVLGQLVVVDAIDHGDVGAVARALRPARAWRRRQMRRRLVACGEDAGAFQRDVDVQLLVRQLGRVLDGGDLDLVAGGDHACRRRPSPAAGKRPCTLS